jgi:hypothetical protein
MLLTPSGAIAMVDNVLCLVSLSLSLCVASCCCQRNERACAGIGDVLSQLGPCWSQSRAMSNTKKYRGDLKSNRCVRVCTSAARRKERGSWRQRGPVNKKGLVKLLVCVAAGNRAGAAQGWSWVYRLHGNRLQRLGPNAGQCLHMTSCRSTRA